MTLTKRQAALEYATIWGWPVFPCLPNEKSPAVKGGFLAATTDPDIINKWFDQNADFNFGFYPPAVGLCVVDLDSYKEGFALPPEGFPDTFAIRSPRGGTHLYFSGSLRSSHGDILGKGIDTRGDGGYVLLPPSTVDGNAYEVLHDLPFAPLPAWVTERMAKAPPAKAAIDELDTPQAVSRAQEYLRHAAPAVEGHSGDITTFNLACDLADMGVSCERALELADDWNERCSPPWTSEELATKFTNAYRYRHDAVGVSGVASAAAAFSGMVQASIVQPGGMRPLTIPEMRERARKEKPPEYLWNGRILRYEPNLITGDAGVGKTTLIENVAVAVAAGCGLLGETTMAVPVLVFVAEDRYKVVLSNLEAISAARSLDLDSLPIKVLSTDSEDCQHLLATITEDGNVIYEPFYHTVLVPALEACPGCLLVFDPLAEFVSFDHNNDKATRACARDFLLPLARRYGASPWVSDHPSKASMATGEHYGGSREMKAAFASFGTLRLTDPKDRGTNGRKALTFEIIKSRYAQPSETNFYRLGDNPAYKLDPAAGMTPADLDKLVLAHIITRVDAGLTVGKTNTIYGPEQTAEALGISTKVADRTINRLAERGLLTYLTDPGKRHPPTWAKGPKFGE